jgi:SpoVK/Ycf46/Vps4 family AAA+-type ATPase
VFQAARRRSSQALDALAQKILPKYRWADIVLPAPVMRQLREVFNAVKYRHVVYAQWGFERKLALGKGLNALFSGPSGAGKTMAADILANELGLDLYKIDLSTVVSKYIGETEKNLSAIFAAARASNAILFFDEADALFGKRSEVKDARDRYANIEIAYLLQRMEEYDGVTILATNLYANMDEAFARRLHHLIDFPFPDGRHRERIWRQVFPAETPLDADVDFAFLARQFELAGGAIRNVALSAAFMAAEAGTPVTMAFLVLGVARELQKLGRLPAKADFRDYYELVLLPE